jgi:hypothetical protein
VKLNTKKNAKTTELREQILKSLIASFKIEGIKISMKSARRALKKIENNIDN